MDNSKTRILIVDDEAEARRQLRKYLELDFWEASFNEANNGREALDILDSWEPKVIISDINMPDVDGLQLLQEVKERLPIIQLIMITGREDPDAPIKALKYGASDYLVKPLNVEELSLAIKRAMKLWEVDDQLEKHRKHLEAMVEKRTKGLLRINETLRKEKETNKELQSQFLKAQKMEAIGSLAGGIAHDFNNILSAIMGFTDMTMDYLEDGSREKKNLQEVLRAGVRARSLVRQILSFSRQDEQRRENVELGDVVNETLDLMRASLPSTITIKHDIDPHAGVACVDQTQISQVLMNLCVNAQHAMKGNGGTLEVSVAPVEVDEKMSSANPGLQVGPHIRMTVADTGHGMDIATMDRIFDPFFTTKEVGEGSGLGLAAAHGIVTSHLGIITVESEPSKGTKFSVYLPRVMADVEPGQDAGKKDVIGGSERILLVDDEESLAEMWTMMLTGIGYQVTSFTSSKKALEAFRERPDAFDLVITDQTMPELTGSDLATEIMVIRHDIPLILCTGFSQKITPEIAKEIGFSQYVMKPVVTRELAQAVRKALEDQSN